MTMVSFMKMDRCRSTSLWFVAFLASMTVIRVDSFAFVPQRLVSTRTSKSSTTLGMVLATPPSKYPTQRGTEVDSRKIVTAESVEAIRINHMLFASEDLARSSLQELKAASIRFDELASQISMCTETREEGGNIGWMTLTKGKDGVSTDNEDNIDEKNEHLDLLLPPEARKELGRKHTKVRQAFFFCAMMGNDHFISLSALLFDRLSLVPVTLCLI